MSCDLHFFLDVTTKPWLVEQGLTSQQTHY